VTAVVSAEALVRRDRLIVVVSAAVLFVLAWLTLMGHQDGHLASPHVQPPGLSAFALTVSMWMVMMVAMMLPPVLPWMLFFAGANRQHGSSSGSVVVFASGYFVVWLVYSVAAGSLQLTLQQMAVFQEADLRVGGVAGGVVLVGAGLFQLTPFKGACLKHCRTPLSFFLSQWRDGPLGAHWV
jgi:predicted metal-binding membrane protein